MADLSEPMTDEMLVVMLSRPGETGRRQHQAKYDEFHNPP
jgi:hypothetical protein